MPSAAKHRLPPGLLLVGVAAAPFCAGAVAFGVNQAGVQGGPPLWPCPFLALTGYPCPMCGATRAVALFMHGDSRFWNYNPWWIVVLAVFLLVGTTVFVRYLRGRRPWPNWLETWKSGPRLTVLVTSVLLAGWAVALLNAGSIAPS